MSTEFPPSSRNRARFLVLALAVGALVAAGIVIATSAHHHRGAPAALRSRPRPSGSAGAGQALSPAVSPSGPIRLVQGSRLVNGVYVGYPHSTSGAVSAGVEYMTEVDSTLDPDRSAAVARLIADPSYAQAPQQLAADTRQARESLGLPASGPIPAGASVQIDPVEYQLRDVGADRITVLLLADYTTTTMTAGSSTRVIAVPMSLHWQAGDWRALAPAGGDDSALAAQPGTAQAAARGWQPLIY